MGKIPKPDSAKKSINTIVEELKKERVSANMIDAIKEYNLIEDEADFKTLFHFLNIEYLKGAIKEFETCYQQLNVSVIVMVAIELCAGNKLLVFD